MKKSLLLFLYLGWKFPPGIEKTEGFHPPKIRFCHPFENYYFPPGCVAYGVGKKKGCQWMQIWFSCLYDSDLRKIDAQIRCNKSSLGIFSSRRKGGLHGSTKRRSKCNNYISGEKSAISEVKTRRFRMQHCRSIKLRSVKYGLRKC